MRNEIETSLSLSSAGEVNQHHSVVMVKKDPGQREAKTFIPEEGALFFGCVLFDRHLTTLPSDGLAD